MRDGEMLRTCVAGVEPEPDVRRLSLDCRYKTLRPTRNGPCEKTMASATCIATSSVYHTDGRAIKKFKRSPDRELAILCVQVDRALISRTYLNAME